MIQRQEVLNYMTVTMSKDAPPDDSGGFTHLWGERFGYRTESPYRLIMATVYVNGEPYWVVDPIPNGPKVMDAPQRGENISFEELAARPSTRFVFLEDPRYARCLFPAAVKQSEEVLAGYQRLEGSPGKTIFEGRKNAVNWMEVLDTVTPLLLSGDVDAPAWPDTLTIAFLPFPFTEMQPALEPDKVMDLEHPYGEHGYKLEFVPSPIRTGDNGSKPALAYRFTKGKPSILDEMLNTSIDGTLFTVITEGLATHTDSPVLVRRSVKQEAMTWTQNNYSVPHRLALFDLRAYLAERPQEMIEATSFLLCRELSEEEKALIERCCDTAIRYRGGNVGSGYSMLPGIPPVNKLQLPYDLEDVLPELTVLTEPSVFTRLVGDTLSMTLLLLCAEDKGYQPNRLYFDGEALTIPEDNSHIPQTTALIAGVPLADLFPNYEELILCRVPAGKQWDDLRYRIPVPFYEAYASRYYIWLEMMDPVNRTANRFLPFKTSGK